jgi:hypothetical protein
MPSQATASTDAPATWSRWRVDRWFYISVALFMILLSVVGFGPSIINQSRRNAPLTPLVTAHGIAVGVWLLLFCAQATLIATRRLAVHRRLGMVAAGLAIVMIVLGYLASMELARRGHDLSGDLMHAFARPGARLPGAPTLLLFPFAELLNFGVLVAAGLWYRRRPDIHKRLMLLALVPLAGEPIVHFVGYLTGDWPALRGAGRIVGPATTLLLLSVSAIHDRVSQGRIHPVSLWVPVLLFAWMNLLPFVVLPSSTWREFAAWLIR